MTQKKKVQVPNCIFFGGFHLWRISMTWVFQKGEKKHEELHASLNQPQSIGIIHPAIVTSIDIFSFVGSHDWIFLEMPQGCI